MLKVLLVTVLSLSYFFLISGMPFAKVLSKGHIGNFSNFTLIFGESLLRVPFKVTFVILAVYYSK